MVFPDRTPKPAMYEHREIATPVRLTYDQGVLLVHNRQRFRTLEWLAADWRLVRADGGTESAPAELPDVRPGESAAVPVPFPLPESPEGEAWLTLRVATAGDEAWAPRGTEVCLPQVRLGDTESVAAPAPVAGPSAEVDDEGLLVHPMLAASPVLSLWRAPTDNDEIGGMAARWRDWGLDALVRKVVGVERDGARVTVRSEYETGPVSPIFAGEDRGDRA